jgi:hypothetical protein
MFDLSSVSDKLGFTYLNVNAAPPPDSSRELRFTVPATEAELKSHKYDCINEFSIAFSSAFHSHNNDVLDVYAVETKDLSKGMVKLTEVRVHVVMSASPKRTRVLAFLAAVNDLQREHKVNFKSVMLDFSFSETPAPFGLMNVKADDSAFTISRPWGG